MMLRAGVVVFISCLLLAVLIELPTTAAAGTDAKPGKCPVVNDVTFGVCIEGCTSDASCPGAEKCCLNGCGHTCELPVGMSREKDGKAKP